MEETLNGSSRIAVATHNSTVDHTDIVYGTYMGAWYRLVADRKHEECQFESSLTAFSAHKHGQTMRLAQIDAPHQRGVRIDSPEKKLAFDHVSFC